MLLMSPGFSIRIETQSYNAQVYLLIYNYCLVVNAIPTQPTPLETIGSRSPIKTEEIIAFDNVAILSETNKRGL